MATYAGWARGSVLAASLALSGALLTSCGGDDPPSDPPSSSTPTTPPSTTATTDPSAPPSSATPAVAPASGAALQLVGLTVHLPEGWEVQTNSAVSANGFDRDGGTEGRVMASRADVLGIETVDYLAEEAMGTAKKNGLRPVREANREVAGVEGYVVTGSNEVNASFYEFGTVTGGITVSIVIEFGQPIPDAAAYVDSVLASVTFD